MNKIKICMFGRFEIMIGNKEVVRELSSSRKRILLLQYLILNRGKVISAHDLFELLWPDEDSLNPESALKTLVSRLRVTLGEYGDALRECVMTVRGGYCWNTAVDCDIDVFRFEALCEELLSAKKSDKKESSSMEAAMDLYVGDLLPQSDMQPWIVAKNIYLHNLYLKTVYHHLELLKTEKKNAEIVQICRRAIDIDIFDTTLNLELMTALVNSGQRGEALTQYKHTSELHHTYLGTQPPESMLSFYQRLIDFDDVAKADIETIRSNLLQGTEEDGALVCDYLIFKDIYRLNRRSLGRLGKSMFLAVISVNDVQSQERDPMVIDKLMRMLLEALKKNLRRGDTIARYDITKYAVLLPLVGYDTGRIPLERVKKDFYGMSATPSVVMNYILAPVEPEPKELREYIR